MFDQFQTGIEAAGEASHGLNGPWAGHIPFAHWIIHHLKPRTLVELGTERGDSYFNFCQAIRDADYPASAVAIDTWAGGASSGLHGEGLFRAVREQNARLYADFSALLRTTFPDALSRFEDGSIDLLHIDGLRTREAIAHDLGAWLPKLSERCIVLLHGTETTNEGAGVDRLWHDLSNASPGFSFLHGHGLGVLLVGSQRDPLLLKLAEDDNALSDARKVFAFLGRHVELRATELEAGQHWQDHQANAADMERVEQARRRSITALSKEVQHVRGLLESARAEIVSREVDRRDRLRIDKHIERFFRRHLRDRFIPAGWRPRGKQHGSPPSEADWSTRKKAILTGKALGSTSRFGILATKHTLFIAHLIASVLERFGYTVTIYDQEPDYEVDDIYVVICPQMFVKLPPPEKRFLFQMEQSVSSRWFDQRYLEMLSKSLATLDYSQRNLVFLNEKGISYPDTFYVPIGCLPAYPDWLAGHGCAVGEPEKEIDVLFYGDNTNPRRRRLLEIIGERFNTRIINDCFGVELQRAIRAARVVVNIHYYENALLESTRIFECLSLGARVVSEVGADQSDYRDLEDIVTFVPVDDVDALVAAIENALAGSAKPSPEATRVLQARADHFQWMFGRVLLGLGMIDYRRFTDICRGWNFPADRLALSLPETTARRAQLDLATVPGGAIFEGLRAPSAWMGCAMSYKFLAQKAIERGVEQLLVFEDDVDISPKAAADLAKVHAFLGGYGDWDLFCGVLSDLNPSFKILETFIQDGIRYVVIDQVISSVYNIYRPKALCIMAGWDDLDDDVHRNTVDRYLQARTDLRVVTTVPFLVVHRESVKSSIWGFGNTQYTQMIKASEQLLQERLEEFLASEASRLRPASG